MIDLKYQLVYNGIYTTNIKAMKLKFFKLQNNNIETEKLKSKQLSKGSYENIKKISQYQSLLYIFKIIHFKLISRYYNNLLVDHFKMKKT